MSEQNRNPGLEHDQNNPVNKFTIIPNDLLRNKYNLHSDELLLLCYLLSHKDGWHSYTKTIMKTFGWGRDKTFKASSGLRKKGFMKREAKKGTDGRYLGCVTKVCVTPKYAKEETKLPSVTTESTFNCEAGELKKTNNSKNTSLSQTAEQSSKLAPPNPPEGGTKGVDSLPTSSQKSDALEAEMLPAAEIEISNARGLMPESALLAFYESADEVGKRPAAPQLGRKGSAERDRIKGLMNRSLVARSMQDITDGLMARGLIPGKDDGKTKG